MGLLFVFVFAIGGLDLFARVVVEKVFIFPIHFAGDHAPAIVGFMADGIENGAQVFANRLKRQGSTV